MNEKISFQNKMNKKADFSTTTMCGNIAKMINRYVLSKFNLVLLKDMTYLNKKNGSGDLAFLGNDFIRFKTLELLAREIKEKGVAGSCAEVGVFRGEFAQAINQAFADKKLYLYDTFAGFHEDELKFDCQKDLTPVDGGFTNTTVALVLNKMKYKENCMIRKGCFPDTVQAEREDKFCFVSLDADLYKPTYNGLCFFYERLSKGGYIMVHDYMNKKYLGAAEAVRQFSREKYISYFVLSDHMGSAVFVK